MKTLIASLLVVAVSAFAEDVSVTLAWSANPEPDIAYYNVKVGTQAGIYTQVVAVGATQLSLSLPKDTLHFAVVTAVNTSALESGPSTELVFQVFRAGQGKAPSAPVGLNKPANLNASLEMSHDLKKWAVVYTQPYTGSSAFWRVNLAEK